MSSGEGAPALRLVKLGGSLITDKSRPRTARHEVIRRLAEEIGAVAAERAGGLIVGHGSGSFGHVPAAEAEIRDGVSSPRQVAGVAATKEAAEELDRLVLAALAGAGVRAFPFAPSAWMMARDGRPVAVRPEPLLAALDLGLVPVVYGDVVMDRVRGAAICSTETVFRALVAALARRGRRVDRVVWLGETPGVLDRAGDTIPRVTPGTVDAALGAVGPAAGTDVTGGMRHRLESALALARRGVDSVIVDGRIPGLPARALTDPDPAGPEVTVVTGVP